MIEYRLQPGEVVDAQLARIINVMKKQIKEHNDDALILLAGSTGSGKSNLASHIVQIYKPDVTGEYIALTNDRLKAAWKLCMDNFAKGIKGGLIWYDEADVESMHPNSKHIKQLTAWYKQNRIVGVAHIWCWPDVGAIPRAFIARANAIIICHKGSEPRSYTFYAKKNIERMIQNFAPNEKITAYLLKKHEDKFASHRGRFRMNTSDLWQKYQEEKNKQVQDLGAEWLASGDSKRQEKTYSFTETAKELGIDRTTLRNKLQKMEADGIYTPGYPITRQTIHNMRIWYQNQRHTPPNTASADTLASITRTKEENSDVIQ